MDETVKKSGFAAIIGRPNVGKSTLMNHLVSMKLSIVSRKPQTTRKRMMTVYTEERGQIVFLDTPGIHKARNRLGEYMDQVALNTIDDSDCVLWLVEPEDHIGEGERAIADILKDRGKDTILLINKTDKVKDSVIPGIIDAYRELYLFKSIIPISAKHGNGRDELFSAVFDLLPFGEPFYDEDTVTNETVRDIVSEMIREQILRNLSDEIPHGTAVIIDSMKERKDLWRIEATIFCEKKSHKGMIIGKGGQMLKKIGTASRLEAEKLLEKKVDLRLWVKVNPGWRDDDKKLRSYGFKFEDV